MSLSRKEFFFLNRHLTWPKICTCLLILMTARLLETVHEHVWLGCAWEIQNTQS